MSRVTSKLQVTIPKAIAERYGIEPGEEIEWLPAGEAIRVIPHADREGVPNHGRRLELFDRATERQMLRHGDNPVAEAADRGWRREDLYARGRTD